MHRDLTHDDPSALCRLVPAAAAPRVHDCPGEVRGVFQARDYGFDRLRSSLEDSSRSDAEVHAVLRRHAPNVLVVPYAQPTHSMWDAHPGNVVFASAHLDP